MFLLFLNSDGYYSVSTARRSLKLRMLQYHTKQCRYVPPNRYVYIRAVHSLWKDTSILLKRNPCVLSK